MGNETIFEKASRLRQLLAGQARPMRTPGISDAPAELAALVREAQAASIDTAHPLDELDEISSAMQAVTDLMCPEVDLRSVDRGALCSLLGLLERYRNHHQRRLRAMPLAAAG